MKPSFYIRGLLTSTDNDIAIDELNRRGRVDLAEWLIPFAQENGYWICDDHTDVFTEQHVTIPNCSIRVYATRRPSSLEEAMVAFDTYLESGELSIDGNNVGYSELTITGFDVNKFQIGGHDLRTELKKYTGMWIHFILEVLDDEEENKEKEIRENA